MRFSVQFERYMKQYGAEPVYPKGSVLCYWFRRTPGKIGKRVNVVLSPEAARHFKIWKPMALDRAKAERIDKWNRKQQALQERT